MGGCSEIAAPLRKKEHDVPDELLELVFLRLPSSLHLVRAACTCKRWRRIIAHGGFLRRFRSLLASSPLVAGHYRVDDRKDGACPPGCNPVFFLSPPADALGFRPEHFSLDFLPSRDSGSWDIADSQGGLVLLSECTEEQGGEEPLFQDLIVCEPLSRQYRVIPRPAWLHGSLYCGAFLLGGDADKTGERISLSNFRIIASLVLRGIARAAIFSSGSESDSGWKTASITADSLVRPQHRPYFQGQVAQSIYWSTVENEIIALHKETAQFSCSFFPDETWYCRLRFVGCDDGKVRIARLGHIHLKVFVKEEGADEWVLEKSVELQQLVREVRNQDDGELQAYMLNKIVSAAEGSVLLCTDGGVGLVSLDLATMELKRVAHDKDKYHGPAYMYELPWPPTIQACLD